VDLIFVFSVGIFFMLLSFLSGFTIGKLIVFLPILWWLYFLSCSKRTDVKQTKVRMFLVVLLVLSLVEAFII